MPKVATNCNLRKRCLTLIDVLTCARLKPTNDVFVCVQVRALLVWDHLISSSDFYEYS